MDLEQLYRRNRLPVLSCKTYVLRYRRAHVAWLYAFIYV
jgi:hypothetical protein